MTLLGDLQKFLADQKNKNILFLILLKLILLNIFLGCMLLVLIFQNWLQIYVRQGKFIFDLLDLISEIIFNYVTNLNTVLKCNC
jgi:hypothetical protein